MVVKQFILIIVLQTIGISLSAQFGQLSHWDFETLVNGEFLDKGLLENHGFGSGLTLTKGVKGNALYFNGDQSFASIGGEGIDSDTAYNKLGRGSISLWFRVDTIPELHGIAPIFYYGNRDACDFFDAANEGLIIEVGHSPVHYRSKQLYFTIWKNGCSLPSFCYDSNEPMIAGEWYHFVAVVGKDYNTGYLNGREMIHRWYNFGNEGDSQFFEDAPNPERLWLGKGHWDRTEQYLKGAIDELRIYNSPLSAVEIEELYAEADSVATNSWNRQGEESNTRIYPNPAGEVVRYDLKDAGITFNRLELFDTGGKLILEKPVVTSMGTLNTAHLTPGVYNLRFSGDQGMKQEHLIVLPRN